MDSVPAPVAHSVNFPVLGICVLRSTNGAMMTFDYGPLLGHGQPDKMGITFFANGHLWAADYGTPGYGAEIVSWYQSTFAHNTIVVDGRDQNPTKENAADFWLGNSWLEAARSITTNAYPGVSHMRTVVRLGDCFIIRDQLQSQRKHDYDFYFHSEGALSLIENSRPGKPRKPATKWIEGLNTYSPRTEISGVWRTNGQSITLTMAGNKSLTPMLAQCPAEAGGRKVDLLVVRQSGRTAEFITALSPTGEALSLNTRRSGELQIGGAIAGILTFPNSDSGPRFVPAP